MSTTLRRLSTIILLAFVLVCFLIWFSIATETGTSFVFKISNSFFAAHLQVGNVQGRLIDTLTAQNVYINVDTFSLKADQLHLSWHPLSLLKKRLAIENLQAQNTVINIKDTTAESKTHQKKNINDWQLYIHSLALQNTLIEHQEKIIAAIKNLTLQTKIDKNIALETHLDLTKPLTLESYLLIAGKPDNYQWLMTIKNAQSDWSAHGTGNQQNINITTTKAKLLGGQLAATAKFNWLPTLNLDIDAALKLDKASATIKGKVANTWNLQYQANLADINQFNENLTGAIHITGNVSGPSQQPNIAANFIAKKIQLLTKKDFAFDGKASLDLSTSLTADKFAGALSLNQANLSYQNNSQFTNFPLNGFLKIAQDEKGLSAVSQLDLLNGKFLTVDFVLPHYQPETSHLSAQEINAKANLQLNPLQITRLSSPWLNNFSGTLTTELNLNGTFQNPRLAGSLKFNSDTTKVSNLGLTLHRLRLDADLKDSTLSYTGSVMSGNGTLQLLGDAAFKDELLAAHAQINGTNFLASNTADVTAYLSPRLQSTYEATKGWHVTGNVDVPRADIKLNSTNAITLPPETVIIAPNGQISKKENLPLAAEITVNLMPKIHFTAGELESLINGQILVQNYPTGGTFGTGKLNLTAGSYNLQGQKLAINQSAIMFNHSPIDNPQLDIRATKKIYYSPKTTQTIQQENLVVGMKVTGTAQDPNITLFSDPAGWSQPDILSLIMLGQPANMASGSGLQILSLAAQNLGDKNGVGVTQFTQQLQQFLGFNELGLQSELSGEDGEEKKTTSFVFGKYLTPRLYLNYSLGMLDAISTLKLKYTISKRWFLQTQSNTLGSGVDLFYFLEH